MAYGMKDGTHTFSEEEEAAFMANPASFAGKVHHGPTISALAPGASLPPSLQRLEAPDEAPACTLDGCDNPRAFEDPRFCARHRAVWERLHA